ncbi:non-specific lipid-transfer protein-like protein At5g64080 isoform X2 [Triticum dicoccoides]|uniref:non-specific lipid-transfer protein-like protein At5g64080 isoform X2 n=1 Tax=Triticum dicoccoides TaxID=85692 RepID=UPI00188F9252|nr:non-specific lipid-transfer protein-like protein At5g64080 isoform X2 [Triticum dicoccoides]
MAARSMADTARPWLLLLAALATVVAHVDSATVAAPAPAVDCSDALISLAGCLSYVQEGSTVATPEKSCCSGLKDVVKKEVACLCQAFQGGQDYGVTLNMTKALQLPGACKVKTPPFSKCHTPAPAPSSGAPFFGDSPSPSTPSAESPAEAGTGSGDSTTARAPSPSASASTTFPASASVLLAAATVAAALLM